MIMFLAILWAVLPVYFCKTAEAFFFMNGVSGTITFEQPLSTDNVTITANLDGLSSLPNKWHIHLFPVGLGCSNSATGGHYNPRGVGTYSSCGFYDCEAGDLSGKFGTFDTASVSEVYSDNTITMFGNESFVGRSIVIHRSDSSRYTCGTIELLDTAVTKLVSTFSGGTEYDIFGTVTFMQAKDDPSSDTWVLVDVSYMDDSVGSQIASSSSGHKYHVHTSPVDVFAGSVASTKCGTTGGHYDPFGTGMTCSSAASTWSDCEVADLSGKHGLLDIPSTGSAKHFYTDTNLPLNGPDSIAGRSVVIHAANSGSPRIACATIGKVAIALFSTNELEGVTGYVSFMQPSMDHNTTITISLDNLAYQPNYMHVHILPSPTPGACSQSDVSAHWNPYDVASYTSCSYSAGTCEVGDITGKFGQLATPSIDAVYDDYYMPLFGPASIIGRSIVIHKSSVYSKARWVCETIQLVDTVAELSASPLTGIGYKAFFEDYAMCGTVEMMQLTANPLDYAMTNVAMEYCVNTSKTTPLGFTYHVHEYDVEEALGSSRCSAASVGYHHDPYETGVTCSTDDSTWFNCEMGDLSGKYGKLYLPAVDDGSSLYTDSVLALSGDSAFSISGRSIVVHDSTGARLDCSDLHDTGSMHAFASFNMGGIMGDITFDQVSQYENVTISVNLTGLTASPSFSWEIAEFPFVRDCAGVGDMFASGDMSGKFGMFESDTVEETYSDSTITLYGSDSIMFRSLLIQLSDGSNAACALLQPEEDWKMVVADFPGPVVRGSISMYQVNDDPYSPTSVVVDLWITSDYAEATDVTATNYHDYEIRENSVSGIQDSDYCSQSGNTFNPFARTGTTCSAASPYNCAIGQLSDKHGVLGTISSVYTSKFFYIDNQLPLSGDYGVGGRSIVIMSQDMGTDIIGCATIGKHVWASIDGDASGRVDFMQTSKSSRATVSVSLVGMQSGANDWIVQSLPVAASNTVCLSGERWNPDMQPTYSSCSYEAQTCDAGDLSGKFGELMGTSADMTLMDYDLPLFGSGSIDGRSFLLTDDAEALYDCGDIMNEDLSYWFGASDLDVTGDVCGTIDITQSYNDASADTKIVMMLSHCNSFLDESRFYNFFMNVKPVSRRLSDGGHLRRRLQPECDVSDPIDVWDPLMMGSAECSTDPDSWSYCAPGDLSARHDNITIGPYSGSFQFFVFTDTALNLAILGDWELEFFIQNSETMQVVSCGSVSSGMTTAYIQATAAPTPSPGNNNGADEGLSPGEAAGLGILIIVGLIFVGSRRLMSGDNVGDNKDSGKRSSTEKI